LFPFFETFRPPGIGIAFLSNMAGFENIMDLDLEMRLSLMDDEDFELGSDSDEEGAFEDDGHPLGIRLPKDKSSLL
jgi:hypothetical protein